MAATFLAVALNPDLTLSTIAESYGGVDGVLAICIAGFVAVTVPSYFCLDSNLPVRSPCIRALLETLVVAGWGLAALAGWLTSIDAIIHGQMRPAARTLAVWSRAAYYLAPVFLALLCWNNLDFKMLRLVCRQGLVAVLVLVVLWSAICDMLIHIKGNGWHPYQL